MKKITTAIALSVAMFTSAVIAAPTWNVGFGQGVTELNVKSGKAMLNFSCNPDHELRPERIVYFTDSTGREIDGAGDSSPTILVTLDGKEIQLSSDGFRAGEGNWIYFWEQAKATKSPTLTVKAKGVKTTTFSTTGLKAIANDKSNSDCTLN